MAKITRTISGYGCGDNGYGYYDIETTTWEQNLDEFICKLNDIYPGDIWKNTWDNENVLLDFLFDGEDVKYFLTEAEKSNTNWDYFSVEYIVEE